MNTITDIKEYLRIAKEKQNVDGMTVRDFMDELNLKRSAAKDFVRREVEAGRLKYNGKRSTRNEFDRVSYAPVYILVPHEA